MKLKDILEKVTGLKVVDSWHAEIFVAAPVLLYWTILLTIIALK